MIHIKHRLLNKLYKKREQIEQKYTDESTGAMLPGTVSQTLVGILQLVGINVLICVVLLGTLVGVIALVVGILLQAISGGLAELDIVLNGKPVKQTVGARYVWNETDLYKFSDEWSRNLYRLAWIISANKELYNSDISTELMLGLPVAETGSNFFPTGTDHYDPPNITGSGKNWNDYSIAEYATVGGDFPWTTEYDYITGLYAVDASYTDADLKYTWGCPVSETLSLETLGKHQEQNLRKYADGDVMRSVYSAAYSVAHTINAYEQYQKTVFNNDADYGYAHSYHKYWVKAAEKYGLDPEDADTQRQVYTLMYYLLHAGGVWGFEGIADDFNSLTFDYAAYLLTQVLADDIRNVRLAETYADISNVKRISGSVLRAGARGDGNIDHAGATSWNDPVFKKEGYFEVNTTDGWTMLNAPTVAMWMKYNENLGTKEAKQLIEVYKKTYLHENKVLVRQANYAVSTCISVVAVGATRLQYIFDTLNINYTTDSQGYVCYAGGQHGESGAVPNGYRGGDFKADILNGYSNIRDSSWFVQLDNSEWSNPLNPNINGGIQITSRYGYRQYKGWDWHSGIDMVYKTRQNDINVLRTQYPVYAMHDGVITAMRNDIGSNAGRYIHYKVEYMRNGTKATAYFTYMHLSAIADGVGVGKEIKAGDIIGYMGGSASGSETGVAVHLHISMSISPAVNGNAGRIDIETALPFVTMYDGYKQWDGTLQSGALKQQPAYLKNPNATDPQIK